MWSVSEQGILKRFTLYIPISKFDSHCCHTQPLGIMIMNFRWRGIIPENMNKIEWALLREIACTRCVRKKRNNCVHPVYRVQFSLLGFNCRLIWGVSSKLFNLLQIWRAIRNMGQWYIYTNFHFDWVKCLGVRIFSTIQARQLKLKLQKIITL